jgi:hypothetical protein
VQVAKAFILNENSGVSSQKMRIRDLCRERIECGDSLPFGQAAVVNEDGWAFLLHLLHHLQNDINRFIQG